MQYVSYGHLVTVSAEKAWGMSNVARDSVRVTGAGVSGYAKGRKASMCSWFNTVLFKEQFWRLWQVIAVYI